MHSEAAPPAPDDPRDPDWPSVDLDTLTSSGRPLLDVIDPTRGACVLVAGRYLDLVEPPAVGPEDLVTIVTEAFTDGEVPIGPLAYTPATPTFDVGPDAQTAWSLSEREPGVTDVIGALRIEPEMVMVGGSRYGWIPGSQRLSSHLLLPDFESVIGEIEVYLRRRANQLSYHGQVRLTAAAVCDVPGETMVLRRLHEQTGELHDDGVECQRFEPVTIDYSTDAPAQDVRRSFYRLACRVADVFGASEPQFFADPDGDRGDDLPDLPDLPRRVIGR